MSKRKNRVPKSGPVWHRTAEEATLDRMPKFNAHACGTGAHGDAKYNRARQKRAWQREMNGEGARNRGRLRFAERPSHRPAPSSQVTGNRLEHELLEHYRLPSARKFITSATIASFSSGLDSAIMIVIATSMPSSTHLPPSSVKRTPFRSRK